jgi:hypothetical protein
MYIQTATMVSNRPIPEKLGGIIVRLASNVHDTYEIAKKIRTKAHEEGFNDDEIHDLLRYNLRKFLDRNQINYVLYVKDQRKEKKEARALTNQQNGSKNVPVIPAPTYNIISANQTKAHEQLIQEQKSNQKSLTHINGNLKI